MSGRFAVRAQEVEYLDEPTLDPVVLGRALRQIERVNRWLGGSRALFRHLRPAFAENRALSILDIGTGAADIPRLIARRAARLGRRVSIVALDSHPQVARYARSACAGNPSISVTVGVGERLPLRSGAVDVAVSSMTLHHLNDQASIAFVREMARVARRAVIVNDLERHPFNYLGARALASTVWRRNLYTRADGPLSVLKGFRTDELMSIGRQAGLAEPAVHRSFPYRLVLVGRPTGWAQ